MEFNIQRKEIETAIDEAAAQESEARETADKQRKRKESLRVQLAKAAFDSIATTSSQDAWDYLKEKSPYDAKNWEIIEDRLPKLIALTEDPNEIYLRVQTNASYYNPVHRPRIDATQTLRLGFDRKLLKINQETITAEQIKPTLAYPLDCQSTNPMGALLGHQEVATFITQVKDNPKYEDFIYKLTLELCTQPSAVKHWHALPDDTRHSIVNKALQFLVWFPHSNGDKYSNEYDELPKIMQLISAETNISLESMKNDALGLRHEQDPEDDEKLAAFDEEYYEILHSESTDWRSGIHYALTEAYRHWRRMSDFEWNSAEF